MGKNISIFTRFCLIIFFFTVLKVKAQVINYQDNWGSAGFTLESASQSGLSINFSIHKFIMDNVTINGDSMKKIELPGTFLPNDEGKPDLPGQGRYIAVPQGANVSMQIISFRTETFTNVEVAPAPHIPLETDNGPLKYKKDQVIYSKNQAYPESPVIVSLPMKVRGVDARIIGITPFQYNPVTKELTVYKDLKIQISFTGGNGHFGEDRLRSRWFDPILKDIFINFNSLPKVEYKYESDSRTEDFEYLIITPDDASFLAWADSIKEFRTQQGVRTGIVTTTQIGGNTTNAIENYIDDAYNTWNIPPAAILFLADYGTSGNTIISPTYTYEFTCISDNKYADVDGDHLPDIATARITAQNASQLQIMIEKFLNYERNPPTNPNFYNNPVTALGWADDRWFQICSETVAGFWENALGKSPKRENAVYSGTPPFSSWSYATNTNLVVDYFGPNGVGYIPTSPAYLNDWGGNAARINNDINSGAFMLVHRDHGGETGWGEPAYGNSNISGLTNQDLVFVLSINCLTGKFNYSSTCFAEAFHRSQYGALGLIAATETSFSFVNDAFCWGMFDYMWPNFLPDYGVAGPIKIMPAFANVYGKYFLQYSNWPYNTSNKECTYYLFHHHGDAFTTVYSEVPQNLTVVHDPAIISGTTQYTVTADQYSLIALSLNGEILGVAEGTGSPVAIEIPFVAPGNNVILTVTKQNYYRFSTAIPVVPAEGPYVVADSVSVNDASGNNNGSLDYGESPSLSIRANNVGIADATNVTLILRSEDSNVTISDSTEFYGTISAGGQIMINDGYSIGVAPLVPDNHIITFQVVATDGANNWLSTFTLKAHAPVLELGSSSISDPGGNNNGILDPGETADLNIEVKNTGSSGALSVTGDLSTTDPYVTINSVTQNYGIIAPGEAVSKSFSITANVNSPIGHSAEFNFNISAALGITGTGTISIVIGKIPALVIDLDGNTNSGPVISNYLDSCGVANDYTTTFPSDVSLYQSLFVCLGIYSSNHVLTNSEGQLLADFLTNGGKIYMEGGDTWYFDDQTPVHPMFNITGTSDGSGDLGTVQGQTGTFTTGMNFTYSGDNSWIDHITNNTPAQMIFKNLSPDYGCGVSNIGTNYQTIGTSFEFGGLSDGTAPSTKKVLMQKIIEFFSIGVPVELVSFNGDANEDGITLKWETATETNNKGFDIEKSSDNKNFKKIGYIEGNGTTTLKQSYTYTDASVSSGKGKFYYRLKQIDFDGTTKYSDVVEVDYSLIPTEFTLSQNYPNPFNPTTTIKFGIPKEVKVTIKVYDILGAEVATIVNGKLVPGYYKYKWNASHFASGVYIYRIVAGSFVQTKKLMLLK